MTYVSAPTNAGRSIAHCVELPDAVHAGEGITSSVELGEGGRPPFTETSWNTIECVPGET
jgi:hypothetical protein